MGYDLIRLEDASPARLQGKKKKRRKRKPRARVALRLNLGIALALDAYVVEQQDAGERVTRTSAIEEAIKQFLKKKGAL